VSETRRKRVSRGIIAGMRVAVVGGPGVGKSTLVRQLGDLYHNGSYGEGEQGVWDPRVLEDIAAGRNAAGVTEYFARLYDANYRDAADHDAPGKVIFFEGARITLEAHMAEYPPESHDGIRAVLTIGDRWNPDRTIVLTSSADTIEKHILLRMRSHEAAANMVRRFQLIDAEFRRLAGRYSNTVVIDRDGREFHRRDDLMEIIRLAELPMFEEIPYRP
jgi:energy-coupling factor transporter ATP-binding protein EcfA2